MPVHVLGQPGPEPTGRVWTCQRTSGGVRCGNRNPVRNKICTRCAKPRPPKRRPKHMVALKNGYDVFLEANGGVEGCGICGKPPGERKLQRDHDHRTGEPRGLLCFPDNRQLRSWMTRDWLDSAFRYVVRYELMAAGRLEWKEEDRGHDTPCWIWQRALQSQGYAVINYDGRVMYVHRIMCHGPIPRGYHVDHLCRNPACVNPAHLEAVTPAINSRRGLKTKLTPDQVAEICERVAGGESQVAVAKAFGISSPHVSRMTRGLTWRSEEAA